MAPPRSPARPQPLTAAGSRRSHVGRHLTAPARCCLGPAVLGRRSRARRWAGRGQANYKSRQRRGTAGPAGRERSQGRSAALRERPPGWGSARPCPRGRLSVGSPRVELPRCGAAPPVPGSAVAAGAALLSPARGVWGGGRGEQHTRGCAKGRQKAICALRPRALLARSLGSRVGYLPADVPLSKLNAGLFRPWNPFSEKTKWGTV